MRRLAVIASIAAALFGLWAIDLLEPADAAKQPPAQYVLQPPPGGIPYPGFQCFAGPGNTMYVSLYAYGWRASYWCDWRYPWWHLYYWGPA